MSQPRQQADICKGYEGASAWDKPAICRTYDDQAGAFLLLALIVAVVGVPIWVFRKKFFG